MTYDETRKRIKNSLYALHGHGGIRIAAEAIGKKPGYVSLILGGHRKSAPTLEKIREYMESRGCAFVNDSL